jgi:hypothetical protein
MDSGVVFADLDFKTWIFKDMEVMVFRDLEIFGIQGLGIDLQGLDWVF